MLEVRGLLVRPATARKVKPVVRLTLSGDALRGVARKAARYQ